MTVGRPRIFDETELKLDDEQRWALFRSGIDAGYTPTEMGNLLAWLDDAEIAASRVTVAKYRRILAELVENGTPPRRRRGTGRRLAAIAVLAATAGGVAHEAARPEPVKASVAASDGEAPIMHVRVNRRSRRRNRAPYGGPFGLGGHDVADPMRVRCAPDTGRDTHPMATAA